MTQIPVSCNRDCGGGCALLACVEDGRVTRLMDSPAGGRYMRGCVRGYQMQRVLYAPDRLRTPLIRSGPRGSGSFRPAEWPEALDLVAGRLAGLRDRYGAGSILHLGSSGSCRGALHHTGRVTSRFLNLLGGATETHGSYSSAALGFVVPFVYGTSRVGSDVATLLDAHLIVLWGANVADCRFGGETYAYIQEAQRRGAEVVVVDPRRSATVEQLGAEWLPVRPGTDAALLLAMLYVMSTEDRLARGFISRYSVGFEALERYVLGDGDEPAKTPAWAAAICGLPAEAIVSFARRYAGSQPVALLPGLSIQRTVGGEDAARLTMALQVATGNLGRRGGSSGAYGWGGVAGPRMAALDTLRVPGQPSIPVYRWPDAILEGRAGGYPTDIRVAYNVGGNYLVQGSDVHKNVRALESLEFVVTHDMFLTPTACYSDVVLPTTTFLERNDIVFGPGNYVFFSNQALPPLAEARNDYDIFCDLAARLGFGDAYSEGKDEEAWLRSFVAASEVPDYDAFKRTGIYWGAEQERVGLADFVANPDVHRLPTPSGRVEIASEAYARQTGFPAIPTYRGPLPDAHYPLRLVTPKSRYRVHSQHSNIAWFNDREAQALWLHPGDAAARGIADGQAVLVCSAQGRVNIRARLTTEMMPGVACLLEGMWPSFAPDGTDQAGCANVLTSTTPTTPSQGSRTHSVFVQVSAA